MTDESVLYQRRTYTAEMECDLPLDRVEGKEAVYKFPEAFLLVAHPEEFVPHPVIQLPSNVAKARFCTGRTSLHGFELESDGHVIWSISAPEIDYHLKAFGCALGYATGGDNSVDNFTVFTSRCPKPELRVEIGDGCAPAQLTVKFSGFLVTNYFEEDCARAKAGTEQRLFAASEQFRVVSRYLIRQSCSRRDRPDYGLLK